MPRRLKYRTEFYEGYKLYKLGKAVGEIRDVLRDSYKFSAVDVKTVNNWRNKWKKYEESISGSSADWDMPWLWEKCDEYGAYCKPSEVNTIQMTMSYRFEYFNKYSPSQQIKPSVREIKYLYLLNAIDSNVWKEGELLNYSRKFAMTEFCIESGEIAVTNIESLREELDKHLYHEWKKRKCNEP